MMSHHRNKRFQLALWSWIPKATIDGKNRTTDNYGWIQLDLINSSSHGDSNLSLRIYVDQDRLLRDCVINPDNIGEASVLRINSLPVKTADISLHEVDIYSADSLHLACKKFLAVAYGEGRLQRRSRSTKELFKSMQVVGTNHCGPTPESLRNAPLGVNWKTDRCCRFHDRCKWIIASGETKYGITNSNLGPYMHCGCERTFYRCLANANTETARMVGLTYFSLYGQKCFYFVDKETKLRAKLRPGYSWMWGLPASKTQKI
ncbi:phospholipase A2 [Clonorchis sinensis]|uniref:Phospholipase A2 n=1 Tax=Clonorchis sinensis TaxID=79923 RepID=G7YK85_CLOSI|nr:phospholipase A2 [Clonorchis sinensis]